jgi:glutathione S-transferase
VPKFLGYFESVLGANKRGKGHAIGKVLTYVDLSLFQMMAGLQYAFPKAMKRMAPDYPRLTALTDVVAARPNIVAYLASERRIPFNEDGIFRYYEDLNR